MKTAQTQFALIAIAVLVLAIAAGCSSDNAGGETSLEGGDDDSATPDDIADQAAAQLDSDLIEDTDEVVIGEMI